MILGQKKSVDRLAKSPNISPKSVTSKYTLSTARLGVTQKLNAHSLKSLTPKCLSELEVFKLCIKNMNETDLLEFLSSGANTAKIEDAK